MSEGNETIPNWVQNLILFLYLNELAIKQPSEFLEVFPGTLSEIEKEGKEYISSLQEKQQRILEKGCFF